MAARFYYRYAFLPVLLLLVFHPATAQPVKLLASDGADHDLFGSSVAVTPDGRYALVGAPNADVDEIPDAGRAYVFERSGDAWTEQARLVSSDPAEHDRLGTSVALSADGQYALVSAVWHAGSSEYVGVAYVFARSGDVWTEQARLVPESGRTSTLYAAPNVPVAISADGRYALLGSLYGANTAHVFVRNRDVWTEQASLALADTARSTDSAFGLAVSLSADGSYALIGAYRYDEGEVDADAGGAFVFARSGDTWTEQAKLSGRDTTASPYFGDTVVLSADGRLALVGAPGEDAAAHRSGSVYVFERSGSAWSEVDVLIPGDPDTFDGFGSAIALGPNGDRALVSARVFLDFGKVYFFGKPGGAWQELGALTAGASAEDDRFGISLAMTAGGSHVFVGAYGDDANGTNTGAVYVFSQDPPPAPDIPYAYTHGSRDFDTGKDVGLDRAGNAYFIGDFEGSFDFDPGPGADTLTSVQEDVYVVSYDPAGALRFAFQLGNAFPISESAGGIAVAPSGRFVITGSQPFHDIDYDPDPFGAAWRTGELFVAGYDADGTFRFAVAPPGTTTSSGIGHAVALDDAGNAYVTGRFVGSLDFNPGTGTNLTSTNTSAFVASYTADGDYRFAFSLEGTSTGEGFGIAADSAGNVYVTGVFRGTVPFDPADTDGNGDRAERTASGSNDVFLAGYTSDGAFRFVRTFGGTGLDAGYSVVTDAAGRVYLTGEFEETIAFDPEDIDGDGDYAERTAAGNGSAFVASYTSDGALRYAVVPEGDFSVGRDLAVDGDGNSFVTGSFGGAVDFDPGTGTAIYDADDGTDVFVASYDATGAFRGAFNIGGDGLSMGRGIAVDAGEQVLLTGEFSNTFDIDPTSGVDVRTSSGQYDLFMAKLVTGNNLPLPVELVDLTAVADGGDVVLHWQTASETNNAGFDVEMWDVNRAVRHDWHRIAFVEGHGSTPEPQTYTYRAGGLAAGTYRFRLKQIDFDGAFAYSPEVELSVGLPDAYLLTPAYPNPFNGQAHFTLTLPRQQQVEVAVYNVLGQRVAVLHEGELEAGQAHAFVFEASGLSSGLYVIRARGEHFSAQQHAVLLK